MASRIITVRSYRRGTGKSTITANLAAQLVLDGFRVGIAEVGFDLPGIKFAFGYAEDSVRPTLNDFLDQTLVPEDLFFHVGAHIDPHIPELARLTEAPLWLATAKPAVDPSEAGSVDFSLLYKSLAGMSAALKLDYLFLDAASAFYADDMALYSMVMSDLVLVVLQPDQQDYQGTAVLISLIRQLSDVNPCILLNYLPSRFDPADTEERMRRTYEVPYAGALPLAEDLLTFNKSHLLSLRNPAHEWSRKIRMIARHLPAMIRTGPTSGSTPTISQTLRAQITGREPGIMRSMRNGDVP